MKTILSAHRLSVLLLFAFACSEPAIRPSSARIAGGVGAASEARALGGPAPWVARHDLSAADYQAELDRWTAAGYRPTWISGYTIGGTTRYAALFERIATPAWVARHGMSAADYQASFDELTPLGYRPTVISAFEVSGQPTFAAIWEQAGGAWVARHGLTPAQYQQELDTRTSQGYRPATVVGYSVGGSIYYAAVFEIRSGGAWVARHGLTPDEYQREFNTWTSRGYRLVHVSGYQAGGQAYYAGIWEQTGGPGWTARHEIANSASYQAEFDNQYYTGYRLRKVSGFAFGGGAHFAAIWEGGSFNGSDTAHIDTTIRRFMNTYNVPGLAMAITTGERLVFAKGYGYADNGAGVLAGPNNLFRIASVSKPITSVAILTLAEQGYLSLDDFVFGAGGILEYDYGTSPYGPGIEAIQVRHLLSHTGGGWTNDGSDPMFSHPTFSQSELISWTLDNRPLDNAPGTSYAYSNFGYCILGRVIEKVTGTNYEAWVQANVLAPSDISDMQIGGDALFNRRPGEVVYYGQAGENPYGMRVARMDSHGGWIASPIDLVRFTTRVDGFPVRPDILSPSSLAAMTTGTSANPGYALGWAVNSAQNYWHNGSLPGQQSIMVRTSSGFTWAIVVNTRVGNIGGAIDQLAWDIVTGVGSWPSGDLF